ncbi:MAG: hypothetical protein IJZ35_02660 [Clostridia bacterium]|nr:hypothetical protein [Clostridia bacterium]
MKRIVALLISIALICTSAFSVVAFAEDSTQADASYDTPIIVIRGMAFTGLTIDEGTPDERESVVMPEQDDIIDLVLKLATTYFVEKKLDVDAVSDVVYKALGGIACDENGDSLYNTSYSLYPLAMSNYPWLYDDGGTGEWGVAAAAVDYYGADKVYFFTYDWRLDPSDTADDLHNMIERAKAEHNSDKVDIVCCSMGGVITDCYIYEYGTDSLDTVVFNSSTFCGTHLTTDLFQGKILITGDMLRILLNNMIGNELLPFILYKTGVLDIVADFAMTIVEDNKDEIYDKMLRDIFATMPIMWAITQPDEYETCMEYMFPTEELKAKYAGLIARADHLQEIMGGMDELLLSLPEKGVKVAVLGSYNTQMPPVYESALYHGDGVLESDMILGRATVSVLGKTLGDDYKGERVSPDNCIDLSNVLFPEYTWAFKDGSHIIGDYGTDCADFIMAVLGCQEQPTVDTFEQYPQFMICDEDMNIEYFE